MTEQVESVISADRSAQAGIERSASLWADAWRDLRRRPVAIASAVVIVLVSSMAAFPWLWTRTDPRDCPIQLSKATPSAAHIFGTNELGCDYYAMTIYGARASIIVALVSTSLVLLVGALVGMAAGFYGGWVDSVLSRLADIFFALPFLLGALVFLSMLRSHSVWTIVLAFAVLGWPPLARIVRASVLATKNMDYVQAARSLGASDRRLLFRHILPNAAAPAIVVATILLGTYVASEATLSYLGIGLQPPEISWGIMIAQGQSYVTSGYPHLLLFPAAFLSATVLAFILLGDALRDALDPKLR
ncbi:ABC transporter permease [Planosporangium mesophilum]|uniref:Peptide ABC transporter permease n=1 Tax=Planosporangium mesophilum TaxID=689768 RepID=A0A8J3T9Q3_9ACTN|nr:ABC transporter permease [Planosporangium mesophilum]GII20879.1 peptide ABC transporter permease [Planosporangium mesophilum]